MNVNASQTISHTLEGSALTPLYEVLECCDDGDASGCGMSTTCT